MMSQLTLGQVTQGVECLMKDHNQKQYQNKIIEICMKQGCTQPNILCGVCKNLHNDHREYLVNTAEIEDAFIQLRQTQQLDNEIKKVQLLIEEFEQFAKKQLEVIVKNMKLLVNPFNVLESIIIKNQQQSYYQLKDQVSELVKLIEFDNFKFKFKQPNQQEINIQINNLANQYLQEINNFMNQHGILGQPFQQSTQRNNILIFQQQQQQQQNNVVTGVQGPKNKDFHFLKENCGKCISYFSPNCVKNISAFTSSFRDPIAYLNRSLKQGEAASLVFKINSIQVSIGIGICQFEKASKFDFKSGIYLADSKGYINNDDYEDYNQKQIKHFNMVQDRKYRFTFDPANKENKQFALEQVDNSENKITMPMKIDYDYNYRIFVCLRGPTTEIELINK